MFLIKFTISLKCSPEVEGSLVCEQVRLNEVMCWLRFFDSTLITAETYFSTRSLQRLELRIQCAEKLYPLRKVICRGKGMIGVFCIILQWFNERRRFFCPEFSNRID